MRSNPAHPSLATRCLSISRSPSHGYRSQVANIDFGGRPQDVVSPKSIARTKEILGDAAEVVGFNHMCALAAPPRRCLLRLLRLVLRLRRLPWLSGCSG